MGTPRDTIGVFVSYAHEDDHLRDELEDHLSLLKRQGFITTWHDRKIAAGRTWGTEIDDNLRTAQVILLLVSADFLASNYCWDVEVKVALERHDEGKAEVIPVILRACDWQAAPFGKLQALPRDGRPVTGPDWHSHDEAFTDVAKGLRKVVDKLLQQEEQDVMQKLTAMDAQQAATIFAQVARDTGRTRTERWKIASKTQETLLELDQRRTVDRAKAADDAFRAMNKYIRL